MVLEGFYTEYNLLKAGIVDLPERAEYVQNPAELVFDIDWILFHSMSTFLRKQRIASVFRKRSATAA